MIKADPGWFAHYAGTAEGRPYESDRPVVAWSDEGDPMVVSHQQNRLVHAAELPGQSFKAIYWNDNAVPCVAAVPGQGWFIRTRTENAEIHDNPVIAFIIRANGSSDPLTASSDGVLEVNEDATGELIRLNPPGGWDSYSPGPGIDARWTDLDLAQD